jgi:hypothetical protein
MELFLNKNSNNYFNTNFWSICIFFLPGEASVALSASGSASLGSASQLFVRDRDRESDREDCESASQLGLAGSIVSNASAARRLEVQAELVAMAACSPNKRSSFASSETASATISLSERSNTLSMADDGAASVASTRALAGSLLSYKVKKQFHFVCFVGYFFTLVGSTSLTFDAPPSRNDGRP